MLGLVAIMGSYTAAARLRRGALGRRRRAPWRWLVLLPAGWVLVEWFRGWFLSGFPWLALGYTPARHAARGLRAGRGRVRHEPRRGAASPARSWRCCSAAGAARIAAPAVVAGRRRGRGRALGRVEWTAAARHGGRGGAGAGRGAAVDEVAAPGQREQTLRPVRRPHRRRTSAADIIVWPEAALPALESDIRDYLDDLHATAPAPAARDLVMGLLRRDSADGRVLQRHGRARRRASSGTTSAGSCRSASSSRCPRPCATGCG